MILDEYVKKRGKLVAVSSLGHGSTMNVRVQCPTCGDIRVSAYGLLVRNGHNNCQPCTLKAVHSKPLDVGAKYGRLTVIAEAESGYSLFKCDCGNEKVASNYAARKGTTQSCGCLRKECKPPQARKGENHHNWKGGISGERERFMQASEYKDWRNAVLKRDNYRCQCCGAKGRLVAHHLKAYHNHPDLRTVESNGVTMCRSCHEKFHNQYGRIDFTEQDYLEFQQTYKVSK